jgi:glutamate-5-semialdehyde dehydrogenase
VAVAIVGCGWGRWAKKNRCIGETGTLFILPITRTAESTTIEENIVIHCLRNKTMSLTNSTAEEAARSARMASRKLAILATSARNDALTAIHAALAAAKDEILAANALDLAAATKAAESGELSQSLVKRLDLSRAGKFEDMLQGILDVRGLEDPIGKVDKRTLLDDGLLLERKSSPIGVLLIIFEARPEVIANIASLAIKSGNAAILKGI